MPSEEPASVLALSTLPLFLGMPEFLAGQDKTPAWVDMHLGIFAAKDSYALATVVPEKGVTADGKKAGAKTGKKVDADKRLTAQIRALRAAWAPIAAAPGFSKSSWPWYQHGDGPDDALQSIAGARVDFSSSKSFVDGVRRMTRGDERMKKAAAGKDNPRVRRALTNVSSSETRKRKAACLYLEQRFYHQRAAILLARDRADNRLRRARFDDLVGSIARRHGLPTGTLRMNTTEPGKPYVDPCPVRGTGMVPFGPRVMIKFLIDY